MDTSLIINATNSGKKIQKAITNINPDKSNSVLKEFAQKVNALTTNNYVDATRVNKMSVEEEGGGTPTFTVDASGMANAPFDNGYLKYDDYTTIAGGVSLRFMTGIPDEYYYLNVTCTVE